MSAESRSILIVYPHDFLQRKMGIDARYCALAEYFRSRGFAIDLFALKNFVSSWDDALPPKHSPVRQLFLYDFAEGYRARETATGIWRFLRPFSRSASKGPISFSELPDYAFPGMRRQFEDIVAAGRYDVVLISYVNWANLIGPDRVPGSEVVLDLSDFTTLNLYDMTSGRVNLGPMLEEEIRRIDLFEKVICISEDERWFFSQFARRPTFYYVPHFMKKGAGTDDGPKQHDLLFVGSDNVFNKEGMDWFFREIYPLLPPSLKIMVVGKITAFLPDRDNVTKIGFVENLDDIYRATRVVICPLLGGTGIKIKIIEALSFGVPVVTTSKGVTGLPLKVDNGCSVQDGPAGFAREVMRLLDDAGAYGRQSERGREVFSTYFEEAAVYRRLDEVFAAGSAGSAPGRR